MANVLRSLILQCFFSLYEAVGIPCSGDVAEPIIQKDGDFMIIGIFDTSKPIKVNVTIGNITQESWQCEEDSIYSLERALAMSWTMDELDNLTYTGGYSLGYAIYTACGRKFLTRYVATQASLNHKVVGAVSPGKKLYVEAAVGPLSSAMITTMSYIYSEDALLEQDNFPHYFSLIETEQQEAMSMIQLLREMEYTFIDIWYHHFSQEMAEYIYHNYVKKVGCGRLTNYHDSAETDHKKLKVCLNEAYNSSGGSTVREADVHLLLFNTRRSGSTFLSYVTDPEGDLRWKNKVYILGYSNARHKYISYYQDALIKNHNGTDSDDLLIYMQSDVLNARLDDMTSRFYANTSASDNALFQKFINQRRKGKCDPSKDSTCTIQTSSWTPYVVLGTKMLANAVNATLNKLAGGEIPCTETFRAMVYDTIVEGGYSLNVEDLTFNDITFSNSNHASGYQIEVWRRSFSLTERQIIGRVSFANKDFNSTLVNTLRPSLLQKVCSEDCIPGYKRHWTNIRDFPCCWTCEKCMQYSFSNTTNSDNCNVCSNDETNNENNTKCVLVTQDYIKFTSVPFICGCVGSIFGVCVILFVFFYVMKEEERPIIKASDPIFCYIFLFSLILGTITALICLTEPSVTKCRMEYTFAIMFISLVTSSLALRCAKIYSLFSAADNFSKPKFGALFTSKGQVIANFVILVFNISTAAVSLYFGSWEFEKAQSNNHSDIHRICASGNAILTPVPCILPALLFIATLILAFKMRKFPHNFRETYNIFMATLVVLLAVVFFLTGYKFSPFDTKALLRSIIMFLAALAFLGCMFVPKIIVLLKQGDIEAEREAIKVAVKEYSDRKSLKH